MSEFRPEEKDVVYIGAGVLLTGAVQAQDTVVVDGAIEGEISCSQLIVGPNGVVNGTISVSDADIYGRVGSELAVKQLLIVRATGRVEGKWSYSELEVEKGGVLSGTAEATESRAPERKPAKEERAPNGYKRPELIVNETASEDARIASLASRALRERRRM